MKAQPQTKNGLSKGRRSGENNGEDVVTMTKNFGANIANQIQTLQEIAEKTDWRLIPVNEKNPIEDAMDKFHRKQRTSPVDFFLAWSVNASVIAERLRRLNYDVSAKQIDNILHNGIKSESDHQMLTICMMECLNDLNKTLYKTNVL